MPSKDQYGFATFFKEDGLYYFQFNDSLGEPVLFSRGYQSEKSRDNGIKAVIRNAAKEERYELGNTKSGKHFFKIKSGNHQEIGRSPLFGNKSSMEEKRDLLKAVQKDTPVFKLAAKETATAAPSPDPPTPKVKASSIQRKGEVANLPRYKFSIIYYPDSDIWKIKHDLSGNLKQFKDCNGALIEQFLKSHLPQEKIEKTRAMQESQRKQVAQKPLPAQAKTPAKEGIPVKKEKMVQKEIELKIHNRAGEVISNFAQLGNLEHIELNLKAQKQNRPQAYQAQVVAQALDGKEKMIIGEGRGKLQEEGGRILISINQANSLKPGMYRFIASVHQGQKGEEMHAFFGSRLVMFMPIEEA